MTTTRQRIEDLDVDAWAAVTRRAAADAVAAAEHHGTKPPAELVTVAAMTERELVAHRNRNGPARERLSPVMRLVEADHRRRVAEDVARDAQQGKLDAEAAAALARSEAEQSSQAATAAREHARTVQAQAAQKERERAAERAAHEQALQQQLAADLAYAPNFEPDEPDRLGGIRPQICLHWAVAPKSTREASRQRARG